MPTVIGSCLAAFLLLSTLAAESEAMQGKSPWPSRVAEEQAIRATSPVFETAFHQHDATVIAAIEDGHAIACTVRSNPTQAVPVSVDVMPQAE